MSVRLIEPDDLLNPYKNRLDQLSMPIEHMLTNLGRKCIGALALSCVKENDLLEFGTWRGYTTKILSDLFPDKTIWSIDKDHRVTTSNPRYPNILPVDEIGLEVKNRPNVKLIIEDSIKLDIKETKIDKIDFAFVDGNHYLEYVQHDVQEALKVVVPGGIVALDDCAYSYISIVNDHNYKHLSNGEPSYFVTLHPLWNWTFIKGTNIAYFSVKEEMK